MVRAAAEAKRQLLVGHVVPFFPEYAFALSAARTGKYGKLLGGHFSRVIADPHWIADYFDPQHVEFAFDVGKDERRIREQHKGI